MMKKFAMRNLRLCTKDCLCLYVCPTGAADTENSIIDREKCIGCGACAESCPSKAISMVPVDMPPQQPKEAAVLNKLNALSGSKTAQEDVARELGQSTHNPALDQLALLDHPDYADVPVEAVKRLLELLPANEEEPETESPRAEEPEARPERWRCTVCGYIHEGPLPEDFTCPRCKQPASVFERIPEDEA